MDEELTIPPTTATPPVEPPVNAAVAAEEGGGEGQASSEGDGGAPSVDVQLPSPEVLQMIKNTQLAEELEKAGGKAEINVNEKDAGVLDHLYDMGKGLVAGVEKGVNATLDLGKSLSDWGDQNAEEGWEKSKFVEKKSDIRIPEQYIPETKFMSGEMVEGISKFLTDFVALGKIKWFKEGAGLALAGKDLLRGGLADFMTLKADEKNLTETLIEAFPAIKNPVTEFLANDGNDPHIVGRLRNSLEGLGLGAMTEAFIRSAKVIRNIRADSVELGKLDEALENIRKDTWDNFDRRQSRISSHEVEMGEGMGGHEKPVDGLEVEKPREAKPAVEEPEPTEVKPVEEPSPRPEPMIENDHVVGMNGKSDKEVFNSLMEDSKLGRPPFEHMTADEVTAMHRYMNDPRNSAAVQELFDDKNFQRFTTSEAGQRFLAGFEKFGGRRMNSAVETDKALKASAEKFSMYIDGNLEHAVRSLFGHNEQSHHARVCAMQLEAMAGGCADKAASYAERALGRGAPLTLAEKADFVYVAKLAETLYRIVNDFGTEAARSLRSRGLGKGEALSYDQWKNRLLQEIKAEADNVEVKPTSTTPETKPANAVEQTETKKGRKKKDKQPEADGRLKPLLDDEKYGEAVDYINEVGRVRKDKAAEEAKPLTPQDVLNILPEHPNFKDEQHLADYLKANNVTEDSMRRTAEAIACCGGDMKAALKNLKGIGTGSFTSYFNFYFVQNILTGPMTHFWNTVGNFAKTASMASERIIAAALSGQKNEMKYALQYSRDLFRMSEAAKLALAAFKTNKSGLMTLTRGSSSKYDMGLQDVVGLVPTQVESAERFLMSRHIARGESSELSPLEKMTCKMWGAVGYPATINSKLMASEDEFFKQLHFRAAKHEGIMRQLDEWVEQGHFKAGSKEYEEAAKALDRNCFTRTGLVNMNDDIARQAFETAEKAVYTQESYSGLMRGMQAGINQYAGLKLIVPFARTVSNVMKDALEHSGLAFFGKEQREIMAAARAEKASGVFGEASRKANELKAKAILGITVATPFFCLADQDLVTAGVPKNPKDREAFYRAGKQPYSIRIGDTWVKYDRIDPIGTLLAAVADFKFVHDNSDDARDPEVMSIPFKILNSVIDSLKDKSFLTGVIDFLGAIEGRGVERDADTAPWIAKTINAAMPASGLVRFAGKEISGHTYEYQKGFTNNLAADYRQFFNSLGVKASEMPAKYDWVTGEAQSFHPIASTAVNNYVIDELERVATQIYGPPPRTMSIHGVKIEFTAEEHSRLCQLIGTVTVGGRTLMESLEATMRSAKYDYDREVYADAPDNENSTYRGKILNRVIKQYRDAALKQLLEEYPEITEGHMGIKERQAMRNAARTGKDLKEALGVD